MTKAIGIHIGGCGARIGQHFWNELVQQHDIHGKTEGNLMFFHQTANGYKANSFFLDGDLRTKDDILKGDNNQIHLQRNMITNSFSTQGLLVRAYYHEGQQLGTQLKDSIRKIEEQIDYNKSYVITSSSSGGFGSGMTSKAVSILNVNSSTIVHNNLIMPNLQVCNPLAIYNTVFLFQKLIEYSSICTMFDNKSASRIVFNKKNKLFDEFKQVNQLYAHAITQITSSFRFPGHINSSYLKLATNLVLFPRMHFLTQSLSSHQFTDNKHPLQQALLSKNFLGFMSYDYPQYFTMNATCRDPFIYQQQVNQIMNRFTLQKTGWLPNSMHTSLCSKYNGSKLNSATVLVNSRSHVNFLKELCSNFTKMLQRKAFLFKYTSYGMDEMQFTEAQSNVNDLITQYFPCGYFHAVEEEEEENF